MLHYHLSGQQHSNTVILIHGFPLSGSAWDGISPYLSLHYKVIVPDLYGTGQSTPYNDMLDMEALALGILDILEKENIDQCIIAGHSMGGYTALECLSIFPNRIRGISLVHSLASPDTEDKISTRLKAIALMEKSEKGKSEFLKAMSQNLFDEDFANHNPEIISSIYKQGMSLNDKALINLYQAIMNRKDHRSTLSITNNIPVQWIIGKSDKATPYDTAIQEVALAEINDVHIWKGVGHMSLYEAPESLTTALSRFCHFCFTLSVL